MREIWPLLPSPYVATRRCGGDRSEEGGTDTKRKPKRQECASYLSTLHASVATPREASVPKPEGLRLRQPVAHVPTNY